MALFQYQRSRRFFAQIAEGFDELATAELARLGATQIQPGFRGLHFTADTVTLYRVNYEARLLTRVLAPLMSFRCQDRNDLYRAARAIDWRVLFSVDDTFGIQANVTGNPNLTHSKFAAQCLKDGVVDGFRDRVGRRPDVDRLTPHVWLNLYLERDQATVSLDTSAGSLHKRGYRRATVEAPMQETLAAAMVALSGWSGDRPLYDPMCGSGTLLCEAWMAGSRIPAGFLRADHGLCRMPDFDAAVWARVKTEADSRIELLPEGLVAGSDSDEEAVRAARTNTRLLPGGAAIAVARCDYGALESLENRIILCNPPYGIRMPLQGDAGAFYKQLGDFLKQRCTGSDAYIYFGDREMIKKIGLKPAWKKPLRNAGLDGRVVKYALY